MTQRKIKISIFVVVVGLVCGYGVFSIFGKNKNVDEQPVVSSQVDATLKNNVEYKNSFQNFTLQYPESLTVKDFDEGEGTHTITFESAIEGEGFQIFLTPYFGDVITSSRMLKDIPNGSFTEPVEIIFGDNIRGIVFFSRGEIGDMREVWFIHNGYLFEVTTYQEHDTWLAEIMNTWRFF